MDQEVFYNEEKIAIMAMGFCYPGVLLGGGDKPPRPECQPLWHPPLLELMPNIELTLLVGWHAQIQYLAGKQKKSLNDTILAWKEYLPHFIPLPHPSWRNSGWIKKNPCFEEKLL